MRVALDDEEPALGVEIGGDWLDDVWGRGELLELNDALSRMKSPARMAFRDFTIWPNP